VGCTPYSLNPILFLAFFMILTSGLVGHSDGNKNIMNICDVSLFAVSKIRGGVFWFLAYPAVVWFWGIV
jgi:hypothetical protein